jgi:UDP-N-acetylglucosamine 4,6-dehydratase
VGFDWTNSSVLVTGGTGSFGQHFISVMLDRYKPRRLAVLSRDELKQHDMRRKFPDGPGTPMRYFLGDVRDYDRLRRAFQNVDVVVHCAALKQVPAAEADPFEAVQTNITGSKNVVDAAIDTGVKRVIALSTDKAVNPANLYGATKLVAEKLFTQGNSYSGLGGTMFACTRYGNVIGSRGSVLPLFLEQRKTGTLTVTDDRMTRFWITLDNGVDFVIRSVEEMTGGEVFVPKIPSMNITDLAKAVAPECDISILGIRPGEKLHEALISEDEARRTVEFDDYYVIKPSLVTWGLEDNIGGRSVPERFSYVSNENPMQVDSAEIAAIVDGP